MSFSMSARERFEVNLHRYSTRVFVHFIFKRIYFFAFGFHLKNVCGKECYSWKTVEISPIGSGRKNINKTGIFICQYIQRMYRTITISGGLVGPLSL